MKIKRTIRFSAVILLLVQVVFLLPIGIFANETTLDTQAAETLEPPAEELPVSASRPPEIVNAKSALVYNFENDVVLFEYNASERIYPTSTVKLMTAIVAYEALSDRLDMKITVTKEIKDQIAGNNVGLMEGEVVTVEQMLSVLLVNSANDAAILLAYAAYGGVEPFVEKMNEKATWLGAYDTFYTNPTGMHNDAMVTTARDTALIAKYAYSIPLIVELTSTPKYVMDGTNMTEYRNIYNRNALISKYYNTGYRYEKALGLNAGSTVQGGYCIAAVAEEPATGLSYLAIVMGADSDDTSVYSYVNAIELLDWAFAAYGYAEVLSTNKFICELDVELSAALDYVTLVPERSIEVYLPTDVDMEKDIRYSYNTYEDSLQAPVEKGQTAGTITVLYGDEILGSCALVTTSDIARSEFLFFLARVRVFAQSRFFIATVISVVVLSILYVFIKAGYREKKLRSRLNRR